MIIPLLMISMRAPLNSIKLFLCQRCKLMKTTTLRLPYYCKQRSNSDTLYAKNNCYLYNSLKQTSPRLILYFLGTFGGPSDQTTIETDRISLTERTRLVWRTTQPSMTLNLRDSAPKSPTSFKSLSYSSHEPFSNSHQCLMLHMKF